jgi:predicted Zn-ribbon and HTH transcriptional regulator
MVNMEKSTWAQEREARAINAEPWEPMAGMLKKQCDRCGYWFAAPAAEVETTSRCPDCTSRSAHKGGDGG